jgi:hypothetical protein
MTSSENIMASIDNTKISASLCKFKRHSIMMTLAKKMIEYSDTLSTLSNGDGVKSEFKFRGVKRLENQFMSL